MLAGSHGQQSLEGFKQGNTSARQGLRQHQWQPASCTVLRTTHVTALEPVPPQISHNALHCPPHHLQSKGKVVGLGVKEGQVYFADVSAGSPDSYAKAFAGADALVLATSGVPKLKPLSLIKVFWAKLTGQQGVRPDFEWKEGQMPEQVSLVVTGP